MSLADKAFAWGQYLIPHHPLSRLLGQLTHCREPWLKNALIGTFSRMYGINLQEALGSHARDYGSFNDFFTRPLKPESRPMDKDPNNFLAPADGCLSQRGTVTDGQLIQAKGHSYSVEALLGGDPSRAAPFLGGQFLTIYLSPRDYHRLHMPMTGSLREMIYVPGRLFSVNAATTRTVPGLFARNERVIALFDTPKGALALVLVGALVVASIETVWHGVVTPPHRRKPEVFCYPEGSLALSQGSEMGRFNMGSTIIVLLEGPGIDWASTAVAGNPVQMGQTLGRF